MENAVKLYQVRCPNEEMALRIRLETKTLRSLIKKFFIPTAINRPFRALHG